MVSLLQTSPMPSRWRLGLSLLAILLSGPSLIGELVQRSASGQENAPLPGPEVDKVLTAKYSKALLIDLEGPIFARFHWYLNHRIDLAQRQQADLIVLRLTSPGGDLEYSLQLARKLRDIDWATTVVFIPEEAISGAAIIALGCDRIYMQEGSMIGDAGPIQLGAGGQFEHVPEKFLSYAANAVREIASSQNRSPALAEAMVDRSLVVLECTDKATGQKAYLSEKELAVEQVAANYDIGQPVPETGQDRFLTVGAARANDLGLSEGLFKSEQELLAQMTIATIEPTRLNWVDNTVFFLNRPWFTALLLIVGLVGMYLELAAPGISVAGMTSLFCFGIFFWSHFLGGTADWLEILLFVLGVCCLGLELFVLPGFGVFGISGLALLVFSLVMASQSFLIPEGEAQWGQLRGNLLMVVGSVLGVMVLFFGQILLLDSIPGLNRFRLTAPETSIEVSDVPFTSLTQQSSSAATSLAIGATGVAESDLRPSGKIRMDLRLVDVITEGDYIEAGCPVEVLRIEGNRVIVRRM